MGWHYSSISKLQWWNRWSLEIDNSFHFTLYRACDYLSTLGLKSINVIKWGPWCRGRNIRWDLGQDHGCWYHGSCRRQTISTHRISQWLNGSLSSQGIISATCAISESISDRKCICFPQYYSDVTWATWRITSSEILLFVQQLIQINNKENITAPHYWTCEGNY